jgi:hypothetical protein
MTDNLEDKVENLTPFFCCEMVKICLLTGRPIEHSQDCPTRNPNPTSIQTPVPTQK